MIFRQFLAALEYKALGHENTPSTTGYTTVLKTQLLTDIWEEKPWNVYFRIKALFFEMCLFKTHRFYPLKPIDAILLTDL